jgi:hypothetical protein
MVMSMFFLLLLSLGIGPIFAEEALPDNTSLQQLADELEDIDPLEDLMTDGDNTIIKEDPDNIKKHDKRHATLLILNKNTLKRYEVSIPLKKTFEKERLMIRVNACFTQPLAGTLKGIWAFLEVWVKNPNRQSKDDVSSEMIYSAWLNNIESYFYSPEYEIQLISCRDN